MSQLTLFPKALVTPVKVPAKVHPDADVIGDEILLESAAKLKVASVTAPGRLSRNQATESRAWTLGGRVD